MEANKQAVVRRLEGILLQSPHRELRRLQCQPGSGTAMVDILGSLPSFYLWQLLNQAVVQITISEPSIKLADVNFKVKIDDLKF